MPIAVPTMALTVGDVIAATPHLRWTNAAVDEDGTRAPDAVDLAAAPRAMYDATRRQLPTEPGVYMWSADVGGSSELDRAVLYLGLAAGSNGLAGRLRGEMHWIRGAGNVSPRWRQRRYSGHPRMMLHYNGRLHHATTAAADDLDAAQVAKATERELLHFSRLAIGSAPLVNGSGWWLTGTHHTSARERAWAAVRRAPSLMEPGDPSEFAEHPELSDPE